MYSQNIKTNVKYYLMYDWVSDEPIFEIPEEEITLYPFYIKETKGKDFISYKILSHWYSIGSTSQGINVSALMGFEKSYEKNNKKYLEFSDYGILILNKNLKLKRDKRGNVLSTEDNTIEAYSNEKNREHKITIKNNNNETVIFIDRSKRDENSIRIYSNKQLIVYGLLSKDMEVVKLSGVFSGKVLTEYSKTGTKATLTTIGNVYTASLKGNTTNIKTNGKTLKIIKDTSDRISSIELKSGNKIKYTEDYDYFDEYVLISIFDIAEKVYIEKEIGYDEIVKLEIRKNVEDFIFYEYKLDEETNKSILNRYISGELISKSKYNLEDGIKDLSEVSYGKEDEYNTKKNINYGINQNIEITRDSNTYFTLKQNQNSIKYMSYEDVRSKGTIKNSNYNQGKYYIQFSGVTQEKELLPDSSIKEVMKINNHNDIERTYNHKGYSIDNLLIENSPHDISYSKQYKSGIGSFNIKNVLDTEINNKYNQKGEIISRKLNIGSNTSWNSLYGYKNGKLSVIKDMIDGVLTYIHLFKQSNNQTEISIYDITSNKIINAFRKNNETQYYSYNKIKKLFDYLNKNILYVTNTIQNIPLIKLTTQLTNFNIKDFKLKNIDKRIYNVGKEKYKEEIDKSNRYVIKYVKDNMNRVYTKKTSSITMEQSEITIYGNSTYITEATAKMNRKSLPISVEIKYKNKKSNIRPGFNTDGTRSLNRRSIQREISDITFDDIKEFNILKSINNTGLRIFDLEEAKNQDYALKKGDFIVNYPYNNGDEYKFIIYESYMPKRILIADESMYVTKRIFISNFIIQAVQSYNYSRDNIVTSNIVDTIGNKIATQDIRINSKGYIESIESDFGEIGKFSSKYKYDGKDIKSIDIYDDTNNVEYTIDYIYGKTLTLDIKKFSVNNREVNIYIKIKDKNNDIIEVKNYRYSIENGFWYKINNNEYVVHNRINKLNDSIFYTPSISDIENISIIPEFWWVSKISL